MTTKKRVTRKRKRKEPAAVWVKLSKLLPWVGNPRKNDPAVIFAVESVKRFGWGAPLVARKANGEILAGHTRIKAAFQLGLKEVPVRYLDLSEKEAHAYAIADNKIGEIAEWHEPKLLLALKEVGLDAATMKVLGFEEDQIARFMHLAEPSFEPSPESEQGVLDRPTPITCPKCHHEFTP